MTALPIFTLGRAAYGLFSAQRRTGVIGALDWFEAALRVVPKLVVYAERRNRDALGEMESAAKAAVPRDTGLLFAGITTHVDDGVAVFEAHALASDGQDYALYVEKGTRGAGVAGDDYFAGDGAHALPGRRAHHGTTPAEPFFYASAEAPLEKRGSSIEDAVKSAAGDAGF